MNGPIKLARRKLSNVQELGLKTPELPSKHTHHIYTTIMMVNNNSIFSIPVGVVVELSSLRPSIVMTVDINETRER